MKRFLKIIFVVLAVQCTMEEKIMPAAILQEGGTDLYSVALDLVMRGLAKVMDAKEYIEEHQKEIALIQDSYELLNNVLCQKNQFDFYTALAGGTNSCLIKFNYRMTF